MRRRVEFYYEALQIETENGLDLDYWLDFVVKNGVEAAIPTYDKMSLVKYYNLDVYAIICVLVFVGTYAFKRLLALCGICKDLKSGKSSEAKEKDD